MAKKVCLRQSPRESLLDLIIHHGAERVPNLWICTDSSKLHQICQDTYAALLAGGLLAASLSPVSKAIVHALRLRDSDRKSAVKHAVERCQMHFEARRQKLGECVVSLEHELRFELEPEMRDLDEERTRLLAEWKQRGALGVGE